MNLFTVLAGLMIISVGLGLGASTTRDDFVRAGRNPRPVLIGFLSQYGFMPLCAFSMTQIFGMEEYLAIGCILTGSAPGGSTSNLFTYWSKGNVALSITMSIASTLAAFGMLPLLILVYIKSLYRSNIKMPWGNLMLALVLIILPTAIGLLIRERNKSTQYGGRFVYQWVELMASVFGVLFLVVALIYSLIEYGDDIASMKWEVWICAAAMEPAGALFGYVLARKLVGLNQSDSRAVSLETGVQHSTLIIAIIALSFDGKYDECRDPNDTATCIDVYKEVVKFPLLYSLWWIINSAWLVLMYRYWPLEAACLARPSRVAPEGGAAPAEGQADKTAKRIP